MGPSSTEGHWCVGNGAALNQQRDPCVTWSRLGVVSRSTAWLETHSVLQDCQPFHSSPNRRHPDPSKLQYTFKPLTEVQDHTVKNNSFTHYLYKLYHRGTIFKPIQLKVWQFPPLRLDRSRINGAANVTTPIGVILSGGGLPVIIQI